MSNASITTLREHRPQAAGLVWEQRPARAGKPGKYAAIAEALRERPNEWALVRTVESSKAGSGFAQSIKTGKLVDFRQGDFEVQVHTVDGSARVYVRYTGAETTGLAVAR